VPKYEGYIYSPFTVKSEDLSTTQFLMSVLNGIVYLLTTLYRTISKLLYDVCYVCYCINRELYTSSIFNRIYM